MIGGNLNIQNVRMNKIKRKFASLGKSPGYKPEKSLP